MWERIDLYLWFHWRTMQVKHLFIYQPQDVGKWSERVNFKISKQHKSGKANLPPLQPPGSLDGMEMFGFSSLSILQVIQSMDKNWLCSEYWESRPFQSHSHNEGVNSLLKIHRNNPDS